MTVLSGWARRVRTSRRVGKCYHVKPRTLSVETKLVIRSPPSGGDGQGSRVRVCAASPAAMERVVARVAVAVRCCGHVAPRWCTYEALRLC